MQKDKRYLSYALPRLSPITATGGVPFVSRFSTAEFLVRPQRSLTQEVSVSHQCQSGGAVQLRPQLRLRARGPPRQRKEAAQGEISEPVFTPVATEQARSQVRPDAPSLRMSTALSRLTTAMRQRRTKRANTSLSPQCATLE